MLLAMVQIGRVLAPVCLVLGGLSTFAGVRVFIAALRPGSPEAATDAAVAMGEGLGRLMALGTALPMIGGGLALMMIACAGAAAIRAEAAARAVRRLAEDQTPTRPRSAASQWPAVQTPHSGEIEAARTGQSRNDFR